MPALHVSLPKAFCTRPSDSRQVSPLSNSIAGSLLSTAASHQAPSPVAPPTSCSAKALSPSSSLYVPTLPWTPCAGPAPARRPASLFHACFPYSQKALSLSLHLTLLHARCHLLFQGGLLPALSLPCVDHGHSCFVHGPCCVHAGARHTPPQESPASPTDSQDPTVQPLYILPARCRPNKEKSVRECS